ncbi:MAG: flavin reductase family protein [Bacillota bacterium]
MKSEYPIDQTEEIFPHFPVVLTTIGDNIITLEFVQFFAFDSPIIGIGIDPNNYSHQLIKEQSEFVINIPTTKLIDEVKFCGNNSGRNLDKFSATGLTPKQAAVVKGQLIVECPINIECCVVKEEKIGNCEWFFGEIKKVHVTEEYQRLNSLLYGNNIYHNLKLKEYN